MTYVTWAIAIWGGALAYTMVGALVWRNVDRGEAYDGAHDSLCARWDIWITRHIGTCPGCRTRYRAIDKSVFWPIYLIYSIAFTTVRALIYIPFRAAAKAIAKPGGTA